MNQPFMKLVIFQGVFHRQNTFVPEKSLTRKGEEGTISNHSRKSGCEG